MKKLAHSPSSIKMYENCPKSYYHQKVAKDVKLVFGEAATRGFEVHTALEERLLNNVVLPPDLEQNESLCQVMQSANGTLYAEHEMAINIDLDVVGWWDSSVWMRAKADVLVVSDHGTATVLDWKTGKPNSDTTQLCLLSLLTFLHFPDVGKVSSGYIWLKNNTIDEVVYKRHQVPELWSSIIKRTKKIEDSLISVKWVPRPSGLCGWCPVPKSLCVYAK